MSEIDELIKIYMPLSDIKIPEDTKERIEQMMDHYQIQASTTWKKRKSAMTWMRSAVALVISCMIIGGLYTYWNHPKLGDHIGNNQTGQVAGLSWGIPANVAWNGYYYETKGYVQKVGTYLGVATYPGPVKIFSAPGQNPDQKLAIEVDTPNGKYVTAVRVQVGTKHSPIPTNWMTINTPHIDLPVQAGEKITVTGVVFFRELYGATIQAGIKRQGANYPQILSEQKFQVTKNGTIKATFVFPKELSGKPFKTQYLLVFRDISWQHPTINYYFPLILKK